MDEYWKFLIEAENALDRESHLGNSKQSELDNTMAFKSMLPNTQNSPKKGQFTFSKEPKFETPEEKFKGVKQV